ncbi:MULTISPECIES: hypothetical protein [Halostella]|uniref:hypothetical protein n=1 Tax=Halostella TaxID=1843185 RepID=UPI0010800AEA|nr:MULTISPECIES: hypothetical protein [Halostella]
MNESPDEPLGTLERALEAYFAADTAKEIVEAVDLQALLSDAEIEEAVDVQEATRVVGRLVGRAFVRDVVGRSPAGPIVDDVVGYGVGATLGEAVAEWLIEQYDPAALVSAIEAELGRSLGVVDIGDPGGVTDAGDLENGVDIDIERNEE